MATPAEKLVEKFRALPVERQRQALELVGESTVERDSGVRLSLSWAGGLADLGAQGVTARDLKKTALRLWAEMALPKKPAHS